MPSRFAFPRIRRFHPQDTTNEDGIPSLSHTTATGSNSSDATEGNVTTSSPTGTSSPTSTTRASRSGRARGGQEHRRRHSRHSSRRRRSSSLPSPSKSPAMMIPTTHHPAVQNFRLRWIDREHEDCAVCTKRFEIDCVVTLLPCGHYFCQACMDQWFWKIHSTTCPLCRYDVFAGTTTTGNAQAENEDDEIFLDRDYQHWRQHHATEKHSSNYHLADMADTTSTDYLSLVTKVVLTNDMSDAKCEKISDSLACDGVTSSFGNNFDLIMAKALHARRARMAYEMQSSMTDSFQLDNQD